MAALVAVPLAGCSSSNVGQAASVNGQRISESDVNRYVTPQAKPVSITDQSGASTLVSPRTFVVEILVYNRLLRDLLAKTPGGAPNAGELAQRERTVLAGKTAKAVARSQGVTGYSAAFNRELLRRLAFGAALSDRQKRGADVNKLAQKLDVRVSLSPRYGRWDAKTLSIDTRQDAGVPSFVTLQPTPSGSAAAGLTNP
jgi:hypothetical protein